MEIPATTPIVRWATLQDMRGRQFRKIFADLENYQSRFFSVQDKIEAEHYIGPLQPLHELSRRVEYPFVVRSLQRKIGLPILDAGSGVTFFPLYLRQVLGMSIECLDKEPAFADRMKQACELMGLEQSIPFHVADLTKRLPFEDHAFSTVLCISVLEHLPTSSRLATVNELWRLVAPSGQLVMTLDVSLTGEAEGLLLSEVGMFVTNLAEVVGSLLLQPGSLPRDLLTPYRPGYGLAPVRLWGGGNGPLIRFGPRSWLLRLRERPSPLFKPLACLLCVIPKVS